MLGRRSGRVVASVTLFWVLALGGPGVAFAARIAPEALLSDSDDLEHYSKEAIVLYENEELQGLIKSAEEEIDEIRSKKAEYPDENGKRALFYVINARIASFGYEKRNIDVSKEKTKLQEITAFICTHFDWNKEDYTKAGNIVFPALKEAHGMRNKRTERTIVGVVDTSSSGDLLVKSADESQIMDFGIKSSPAKFILKSCPNGANCEVIYEIDGYGEFARVVFAKKVGGHVGQKAQEQTSVGSIEQPPITNTRSGNLFQNKISPQETVESANIEWSMHYLSKKFYFQMLKTSQDNIDYGLKCKKRHDCNKYFIDAWFNSLAVMSDNPALPKDINPTVPDKEKMYYFIEESEKHFGWSQDESNLAREYALDKIRSAKLEWLKRKRGTKEYPLNEEAAMELSLECIRAAKAKKESPGMFEKALPQNIDRNLWNTINNIGKDFSQREIEKYVANKEDNETDAAIMLALRMWNETINRVGYSYDKSLLHRFKDRPQNLTLFLVQPEIQLFSYLSFTFQHNVELWNQILEEGIVSRESAITYVETMQFITKQLDNEKKAR